MTSNLSRALVSLALIAGAASAHAQGVIGIGGFTASGLAQSQASAFAAQQAAAQNQARQAQQAQALAITGQLPEGLSQPTGQQAIARNAQVWQDLESDLAVSRAASGAPGQIAPSPIAGAQGEPLSLDNASIANDAVPVNDPARVNSSSINGVAPVNAIGGFSGFTSIPSVPGVAGISGY